MSDYVAEFEWLASNRFIFYPFAARAVTTAQQDICTAVVDALIVIPEGWGVPAAKFLTPGVSTWDITLEDTQSGATLTETMSVTPYGPWDILASDHARLLLHREEAAAVNWADELVDAVFVPHTLQKSVSQVDSIVVHGDKLTGDITLRAGYNTALDPQALVTRETMRPRKPVRLSFPAGAGEGRVPCDEICGDPMLASINTETPNAMGDIALDGVDCYSVDAELDDGGAQGTLLVPGRLNISNSCSPCCDCADYGYVYGEVLGKLLERAKLASAETMRLRAEYEKTLEEYNRVVICRMKPTVEMQVTGMYGRTGSVAVGFRNNSEAPWPMAPTKVSVKVDPAGKLVKGSAVQYDGSESEAISGTFDDGVFTFTLNPIPCCSMRWVSFNVVWNGIGGIVIFNATAKGTIEDVTFDLIQQGSSLPPVNRDREETVGETYTMPTTGAAAWSSVNDDGIIKLFFANTSHRTVVPDSNDLVLVLGPDVTTVSAQMITRDAVTSLTAVLDGETVTVPAPTLDPFMTAVISLYPRYNTLAHNVSVTGSGSYYESVFSLNASDAAKPQVGTPSITAAISHELVDNEVTYIITMENTTAAAVLVDEPQVVLAVTPLPDAIAPQASFANDNQNSGDPLIQTGALPALFSQGKIMFNLPSIPAGNLCTVKVKVGWQPTPTVASIGAVIDIPDAGYPGGVIRLLSTVVL